MLYYLICDNENRIFAIHKTPESARFCFKRLTELTDSPPFIHLIEMESNEIGVITRHATLATYSKSSSVIVLPEGDDGAP
jgi:hypothetical protein